MVCKKLDSHEVLGFLSEVQMNSCISDGIFYNFL